MQDEIRTIGASEILRNERYALVRMLDGEVGWLYETYSSSVDARRDCEALLANGEYEVVRVDHTGDCCGGRCRRPLDTIEALKEDLPDRAHYSLGYVIEYMRDEILRLVDENRGLVFDTMSELDHFRHDHARERYQTLREVMYLAAHLAHVDVDVPEFPFPEF